jgi:RNA polymerase sigma-70 factor (ECF subfamily)
MEIESLAVKFEDHRSHLRGVAYRMLGSQGEADDAVQEAWVRLSRADTAEVKNLRGWLTTVTARVCLDFLRARATRQRAIPATAALHGEPDDPARELQLAESVSAALIVVLETLAPAERVAFVLHDMFDLPFDEIARIIDRSEPATRQLASRARRRIQRREPAPALEPEPDPAQRAIVDAFLTASREGDLDTLLAVLDPDIVVRADELAVRTAAANKTRGGFALERELRGAHAVATTFKGSARGAVRATIDGEPGAVWAVHGHVRSAFVFAIEDGRIRALDLIMEPDALAELDVVLLDA